MTNQIEPNVDMPVIRYGGVAYPVLFAVASIKRWGEKRGLSFAEACEGWGVGLSDEELAALMLIVLNAGERRRRLSATDENHAITESLVADLFETYHIDEITGILMAAWNQPPGRAPDPPVADLPPTGETSSS